MTAGDIRNLLLVRHADSVCVPECNAGPSWDGAPRLDLWVMEKSWAHPRVIGYEIKCVRGDFLKDNKWPAYLPYCNEFYFVCVDGVADKREVSDEVGLLTVAKTGTRLFTRKKAPYRDVQIPDEIFRYILMNRVKIYRDNGGAKDRGEYWREWLEQRKSLKTVGHLVSRELRRQIEDELGKAQTENANLKGRVEKLESVKALLDANGVSYGGSWRTPDAIVEELEQRQSGVAPELRCAIERAARAMNDLTGTLARIEKPDAVSIPSS